MFLHTMLHNFIDLLIISLLRIISLESKLESRSVHSWESREATLLELPLELLWLRLPVALVVVVVAL